MIGHRANGALAALHLDDFRVVGFGGAFERLAVNKWAFLSPPVLIGLWILIWQARSCLWSSRWLWLRGGTRSWRKKIASKKTRSS